MGRMVKLPLSAFFDELHPEAVDLKADLEAAGFGNVRFNKTPRPGSVADSLIITPPDGSKIQISPPGDDMRGTFDVESLIQILTVTGVIDHRQSRNAVKVRQPVVTARKGLKPLPKGSPRPPRPRPL